MHVLVSGPLDYIQICVSRQGYFLIEFIVHEKKISQRASVPYALCSLSFSDSSFYETLFTKEMYRFNDLHK